MDLSDQQWAAIKRFVAGRERERSSSRGGRPWRDPRDVLNGILWVLRIGAPWADLPGRYPPYQTCHRRFQKWDREGVLDIGDRAYDSDKLDDELAELGVEMIAPHHPNRKRKTQDGCPLRRYRRRWYVERLLSWLSNFRRLVTRYEYYADNFLGLVKLGCIVILLRRI